VGAEIAGVLMFVGVVAGVGLSEGGMLIPTVLFLGLCLLPVPLFSPRPHVKLNRLVGPFLLAGVLIYTGAVSSEIRRDNKMAKIGDLEFTRLSKVRNLSIEEPEHYQTHHRPKG
jgi:hypothetical protein